MLQARRALVVLISVVAAVAGFTPASGSARSASLSIANVAPRSHAVPVAIPSESLGYWLVGRDGGIFSGGNARFLGSTGAIHLARPIVGMAATPSGDGYWTVASDGGIFAFGDADFHGSTGAIPLNKPIVGIAPTPSGAGYWMVASDGGIFAFGDAAFHGSTGAMHLNKPIVGIAATPSGHGYWLVASDGGVFAFGDAAFHGSTGAMHLNQPIVGISSSLSGHGYRMVASDGGVFSFGDARFFGSTGNLHLNQPIVGLAPTASGLGYWFVASDGGVFSFGDAAFFGSAGSLGASSHIVGMAATAPVPVATKLAFTTQPGASTGGLAFGTQPAVTLEDANGAPVTGDTSAVRLALTGATGATLDCATNPKTAVAGVATFAGCDINTAGTYTLTATSGSLTSAVSTAVVVSVGAAAKLAVTTQPSGAVLGVAFGTQPVVSVLDAGNNLVTAGSTTVALTLTPPLTGTPILACTTSNSRASSAGHATFTGCNIDTIGDYSLTATGGGFTAVSSTVQITNIAAQLAFTTQPSATATGGTNFAVQPVVTVQDSTGHTIVADTRAITLTVTTGGATVPCTTNPQNAVAGVATFAGCHINAPVTSTLTATGTFTVASTAVTVTVGAVAHLAFTVQPVGSTGGLAFGTQPTVTAQDAGNNTVTSSVAPITLAASTPAAGVVVACTTNTVTPVNGVSAFLGCHIDLAGAHTLTANNGAVTGTSASVTTAVGPVAKLAYTTEPSSTASGGLPFGTQPAVTVQDAGGNTVTAGTDTVTLTVTAPATGAVLTCTTSNARTTAAGVATFQGCSLDLHQTHTLTATATTSGFTVVSSSVAVATGIASHLVFSTPPVGSTGGLSFDTQPVVTVKDAGGNTVSAATPISLATTTPVDGAPVVCTNNTVNAIAGVATFAGCHINLASTRSLTATGGGFTVDSANVTTAIGPVAQLVFSTVPVGSTGGLAFGTQPAVTVQDAGGNTVNAATPITLSVTAPANGAAVVCTNNTVNATVGVAIFAACHIDLAPSTRTLTATGGGFTVASAGVVTAVGAAAQVAFTTPPSSTATGGTDFAQQPVVTVQDAGGNTVVAANSITLTVAAPTGGSAVSCTNNTVAAPAGVATFAGCDIDLIGSHRLTATATTGGFTVDTGIITITVGAASQVEFVAEPGNSLAGVAFTSQPAVAIQDAGGNTVTSNTSSVTLTLTPATAGSAVLACTNNTLAAINGVASFAGCSIDLAGNGYTLTATDTGFTRVGTPFNVA